MPDHSVRITFPNNESRSRFVSYMASSGSQAFFKAETETVNNPVLKEDQICGFEYTQGPDGSVMLAQTEADL